MISLAVFFIFYFWYLHDIIFNPAVEGNVIIGPLIAGFFFGVPTFIIGVIISKILNRPKRIYDPEMIENGEITLNAINLSCNDKNDFNKTVQIYTAQGYKLKNMSDNMAILAKKSYNMVILILTILFLWPAAVIYIIYFYYFADEDVVIITLDKNAQSTNFNSENKESTAYCTECGQALHDNSKFCPNCGVVIRSND